MREEGGGREAVRAPVMADPRCCYDLTITGITISTAPEKNTKPVAFYSVEINQSGRGLETGQTW